MAEEIGLIVPINEWVLHEACTQSRAFDRAGLPPLWIEVRGPKGSVRAPNTFARVLELLEPLGYAPHRWRNGEVRPVHPAEVVGREDILFRVP